MRIKNFMHTPLVFCLVCLFLWTPGLGQELETSGERKRGVCAQVRISISQDAVLTRSAFRATLEITNAPENVPLTNFSTVISILDPKERRADELFSIDGPKLTGLKSENGGMRLTPGSTATAIWTIVPGRKAAKDGPVKYKIGGRVSYRQEGLEKKIPLLPATVLVRPGPRLTLDYFLPRQVYGDDPFTRVKEKAVPYSLGTLLVNRGKGTAHDMRITSAQPKIIENRKGLLVDFSIIETSVNGEPAAPSLTAKLGSIAPAETAVVVWTMKSSLQGRFIDYETSFEHTNGLGDENVSLFDEVKEHELAHVVRADFPSDDGRPDFLINEIDDETRMPDTVIRSDGSSARVNVSLQAEVTESLEVGDHEVVIRGAASKGFHYIRIKDPSQGRFSLTRVVRSDGKEVSSRNFWTTHRTVRPSGKSPIEENKVHLFDHLPSKDFEYRLVYGKGMEKAMLEQTPGPPVLVEPPHGEREVSLPMKLRIDRGPEGKAANHAKTRWQVSTSAAFSNPSIDIESPRHLLLLPMPEHALAAKESYLWRARIEDTEGRTSSWAEPARFKTMGRKYDRDGDGLADDQEVAKSLDLDGDGVNDARQKELKCIKTTTGNATLCVESPANLTYLRSAGREEVVGREKPPQNLTLGLVKLRIKAQDKSEATPVTFFSSRKIPKQTRLYLYALPGGWKETAWGPGDAGESVAFELIDGSPGDMDGIGNKWIVATVALEFPETGELSVAIIAVVMVILGAIVAVFLIVLISRKKKRSG